MSDDIKAIDPDRNGNNDLIAACYDLGYLNGKVLDATYGEGAFWRNLNLPIHVFRNDLDPMKGALHYDFRCFPPAWERLWETVIFDPPYKLNGTPSGPMDDRYGVGVVSTWRDRMQLCLDGITGCWRVLRPRGHLLVKCQAQVCSGKVRWQDRIFADHAESLGMELVDRLDLLGGRPQPEGRRQVHARRNHSTLLVLKAH